MEQDEESNEINKQTEDVEAVEQICNKVINTDLESPEKQMEASESNSISKIDVDQKDQTEFELLQAVLNQESVAAVVSSIAVESERHENVVDESNKTERATTPDNNEASEAAPTILNNNVVLHDDCIVEKEKLRSNYEAQLEQLRIEIVQKDNMIVLFQRENTILEKEKDAFRKERDMANREKESTVIKFATKEKLLLDAKKEKDGVEKQLADARKEIKNISTRFQAINEEKSRMTYIMDEKCNEVRKYQRECEKLKTDYGHLESKLKYHVNKLNMEIEAKVALEKKLETERNAPNKLEEKANEKLKMEFDANMILIKHELERKVEAFDNLNREHGKCSDVLSQLQEQLNEAIAEKTQLASDLSTLREEHNGVQNAYSEEMLHSSKLRGQLEQLQVLKTQNTLMEEKICSLKTAVSELEELRQDNEQDLMQLHAQEQELLNINKEISETIVMLQNKICLLRSKAQGIEAENEILKKEKLAFDSKYEALEKQLSEEAAQKTAERQLLAKHLSEKTKLHEMTKTKLENLLGDYEATKHKHATVVKELQREIQKYKKSLEQNFGASKVPASNSKGYCSNCHSTMNGYSSANAALENVTSEERTSSRNSNQSEHSSRRQSNCSETETMASGTTAVENDAQGPSRKHLVDRILRLQQASARQTEKVDFLENHTLSLVAELQKKSKLVQHYMLRDQSGALTSSKSDQHKKELAKYGNGVMAAIYSGIKSGENKSMTLELSLEINKKLQAVLEDTLLKNITLKENLDVLGLEVDNLTRKLRRLESRE